MCLVYVYSIRLVQMFLGFFNLPSANVTKYSMKSITSMWGFFFPPVEAGLVVKLFKHHQTLLNIYLLHIRYLIL